jgi:ubiquinone/menaquinone biosynthesis C-methylase UbiE
MDPRVQRRIQRYGWDLAAHEYDRLWGDPLGVASRGVLAQLAPHVGERVLDVACGTGTLAFALAEAVGSAGAVVGVDLSAAMVGAARRHAATKGFGHVRFDRMDGEAPAFADASFDAAACALGLMYMPDPTRALREIVRVLRPGGRAAFAVWGERTRCGWSPVLPIVDAEVASDVCPLFFSLGSGDALARACRAAGFAAVALQRITTTLPWADADDASDAALVAGPVALAWSRFDAATRARVRARYLAAIAPWRVGDRYEVPGEFVLVLASVDAAAGSARGGMSSAPTAAATSAQSAPAAKASR